MPFVVVTLILIAVAIAFATGFLSLRKTGEPPPARRPQTPGDPQVFIDMDATGDAAPETPDAPAPLIDLVDYYADYEPEPTDEKPKDLKAKILEAEELFDRLCNTKIGRGYLLDCQTFLHSAAETGQRLALCRFDFNRFRFINTLRGYSTGDYALTRLSQEIRDILPDGMMLTRLSADHFAALFVYIDDATMEDIFEKLRRSVDRIRGDLGAKSGMQLCMGLAITSGPADYDIFKMLRRANIARHCQKAVKSESYVLFDESMLTSYLYGESSLDDYNEHQYADDFEIFLRPQILMASKRITSCDSMVRWSYEIASEVTPPEDGTILPDSNLKVIYQAMRALTRWRKAGHIPLPVMVGVNEIDLFKEDIDEFFAQALSEFQLDAAMLTVRVSLHDIRVAPELAAAQIKKLADIGLKIAICDIDRGAASTEALTGLTPNYLKLHKSFLHDIEKKPERRTDISQAISLANGLGAGTIFEGVDNGACLTVMSELGATLAQGRFVGRCTTVENFTEDMVGFLKGSANTSGTVVLDELALNKGEYSV